MTSVDINTRELTFNKEHKILHRTWEGRFPKFLNVVSEHTGREVLFLQLTEGDPMFDCDLWDGEQMMYSPAEPLPNCKYVSLHYW